MDRPNILIIYTDQQRFDALGANGNRHIHTPNLDALAHSSANFTNCFVQNPLCMPSRASFMTGRYPSALGITYMGVPLPEDTLTLPRYLTNYGYTAGNIGKLHFLPHANRDHRNIHPSYGFDHLEISDEPGCYEDSYRGWVRTQFPDQLEHISLGLPPAAQIWQNVLGETDNINHPQERFPKKALAFRGRDEATHSAFVAERTISFIEQNRAQPWMCVAGFYSPHSPWVAPQRFLDMYDPDSLPLPDFPDEINKSRNENHFSDEELRSAKHGYYAMISEVDYHVGRILDCLEAQGLADDTVVVFTSDHGEWLGDHLKYGKGYPGLDSVTHVPLIIRRPQATKGAGADCPQIVESIDVVPTLLQCAGIPIAPDLQGQSLCAALGGKEFAGKNSAITEFAGWKTLRTRDYRYVCEADGKESLYDLKTDAQCYNDVSDNPEYAEVLSSMRHKLLLRILKQEQPLRRVWPY